MSARFLIRTLSRKTVPQYFYNERMAGGGTAELVWQCWRNSYPLSAFLSDCDRRTEQAKKRLAETQEELSAEASAKASIVNELGEQIGVTLAKVQ